MCNRIAIQMDTRVKTVMGPTSSIVRVEVQHQWEGDLYGGWTRGRKAPLRRVLKEGGYPLIPPLLKGANRVDGKARDPGYKRLDWCRTHFVCSWSFKMADFPVLPDDVLLMIAHEHCLATVEDRALDGWWTVNAEMRQLPQCPKRKQIINVKGF